MPQISKACNNCIPRDLVSLRHSTKNLPRGFNISTFSVHINQGITYIHMRIQSNL
uniref:Uncharacterized protein n=1 Tax=Rhizophora mucronata TaxID=61149 RepID=A0A2P2MXJ9_RHIMU